MNITLNDLSAFRQPGKNWSIGSDVHADFNKVGFIELIKGAGMVVNTAAGDEKTSLVTTSELGNVELEFDFLLAKATHASVFLQGRYEVHLSDSWAKQVPHFSDCGGIAERWDESRSEGNRGFEGIAPSMNVCRAPGLWQHLKVTFRAPQINEKGEKTANAKFEEVYLNGTLVQEEVRLSGPSRNAVFSDEKSMGPLVFQSDDGPIAFRNIRYRMINTLNVTASGLKYRYFKSDFKNEFPDLTKFNVSSQDTLSQLTGNVGKGDEVYALDITGDIKIPAQDNYTMSLLTNGMGRLYIDDQLLIERITSRWNNRFYTKQVSLTAGKHTVRIIYVKNIGGQKPALVLSIQGVNTDRLDLTDKGSAPARDVTDPIFLQPQGSPYLLRSFLNYGDKKLTHTISVGNPNQLNYSYDLKQGALIQIWRGEFLDVTNMWVQRGEPQLAIPRGSVTTLSDAPAVAILSDANAAWPDSVAFDELQNKGYTLDDERAPTFRYVIKGVNISDKISTGSVLASILRQLTATNPPANLYCRIASGVKIDLISEGIYRIDDKSYYVVIDKKYKPLLRQTKNGYELIAPFENTPNLNYIITW
ncbi:MAG: family 16 glycoside hydrolase [Chitinophagaceae bacterium]